MLSSIINEYTNTKNQAITKEDREYLMNNKSAPNHFEVYVGYSSDTNKETRVWHSGTSFVLSDKHVPYAGTQKKNSQVTMIHLQNSIFVSRCCYIDNVPFDNSGVIENKFYKIWPLDRIEYKWPINEHLNLADLENVRHQFTSPQIKIVE